MIDIIKNGDSRSMSLDGVVELFFEWAHKLESEVQDILDTSLPNKQQHRAATKLLHERFVVNTVEFKIQLTGSGRPLIKKS